MNKNSLAALVAVFVLVTGCGRARAQPAAALAPRPASLLRPEAPALVPVREALLPGVLETTGLVAFDDRRIATISSRAQGRIEKVLASVWDTVEPGQPILELYSPDFMTAEAEYLQAKKMNAEPGMAEIAAWMLDAAKRKLELLGMADQDIAALTSPSTNVVMRAPIGGTILQNLAVRGAAVSLGDSLFQIGALDRVWITADLYESDLSRVAVGQAIVAVTPAFPREAFRGRIARISPSIDPNSHTAQIKCELDNPGAKLKPQMLARVRIMTKATPAFIVSQESLVFDDDSYYVFVQAPSGAMERRKVAVGEWSEDGFARVISGLEPGERVAPDGLKLNALWHRSRGETY